MRIYTRSGQIIDGSPGFGMPLPGAVSPPFPGTGSGLASGVQGGIYRGQNRRVAGAPLPLREIGASNRIRRGPPELRGAGAHASGNGPSLPYAGWL